MFVPVRRATIIIPNQLAASEIVDKWLGHYYSGALTALASGLFAPLSNDQRRLDAIVDGRTVSLRPSYFRKEDDVVFVAVNRTNLTVGFYDLSSRRFLQGLAELPVSKQFELASVRGGRKHRVELIAAAREYSLARV